MTVRELLFNRVVHNIIEMKLLILMYYKFLLNRYIMNSISLKTNKLQHFLYTDTCDPASSLEDKKREFNNSLAPIGSYVGKNTFTEV